MELETSNMAGETVGAVEVSDYVFAVPMNSAVLHQAVVAQASNRRQGTHSTRTRSQVVGSGRKLRTQKHTGRARLGDAKNPSLRGGGVAHGPQPRDHRKRLPVRVRRLALRIALSDKVRTGNLSVIDDIVVDGPATKTVVGMVAALGLSGTLLVVTPEPSDALRKSVHNLQDVETMPARLLNPLETTRYRNIVMSRDAAELVSQMWGEPTKKPARSIRPASKPTASKVEAA